jgi:hypothetical protein
MMARVVVSEVDEQGQRREAGGAGAMPSIRPI